MMKIRILVKRVDHDGFNGREFPPLDSDVGVEGLVTNIDLEPGPPYEHIPGDDPADRHEMLEITDGEFGPQIFYVRLDNKRNVCLLGHEFYLVSCTHDGNL